MRPQTKLSISEGALASLFERVKPQLEPTIEAIVQRLRSSRLVGSDETNARVQGKTVWEWVFQNAQVCLHVIRPSRGADVMAEVMNQTFFLLLREYLFYQPLPQMNTVFRCYFSQTEIAPNLASVSFSLLPTHMCQIGLLYKISPALTRLHQNAEINLDFLSIERRIVSS